MLLTVFFIAITAAIELGVHALPSSMITARKVGAICTFMLITAVSVVLCLMSFNLFVLLLLIVMAYRGVNMARIMKGRMHENYLWHVSYRTGLGLLTIQLVLLGLWAAQIHTNITSYSILVAVLVMQLIALIVMYRTTAGHALRMQNISRLEAIRDKDLPSLTVAIPARNETESLHDCIKSLLASNYPKLEILVLDDCSQTTRTPEIIRSFAHDGVRFIQGTESSDTWLAKNQAYDALLKASSGEWLLFAGVDIRFDAASLRQLVAYALAKQKDMVCVMPHNVLYHGEIPLIQPMRYLWELALPRRSIEKPPVLSSCWLIDRQALQRTGGFEAASRMIVPEAYFAKQMLKKDGYGFLASGNLLGIISVKDVAEQRQTSIRVAYPQVHRRPEVVALITFGYIAWIASPLIALILGIINQRFDVLIAISAVIICISGLLYSVVLKLAYGKVRLLQVCSFPLAVLVYVTLLHYSMFKYEFSEVIWKGRNVCLPVMHVIPKLPRI